MQPRCKMGSYSWIPIELFLISMWFSVGFILKLIPASNVWSTHRMFLQINPASSFAVMKPQCVFYASVTKHLCSAICIKTFGRHFSEIPHGIYSCMLNMKVEDMKQCSFIHIAFEFWESSNTMPKSDILRTDCPSRNKHDTSFIAIATRSHFEMIRV